MNEQSVEPCAAPKSHGKRLAPLALLLLLPSVAAQAQTPPDAPPAAEPPAAMAPPPAEPPPPAPAPPVIPAVEAATKPPTNAETMAATRPEVLPPIDVGAWVRAGSVFQSGSDPKKMNDWHMDTSYVELHAGGKIHKNVGVTLNLNANLLGGTAGIEDAIISFDFLDEFHLWGGQLLVPVDRSNASGPFFMIPWNYPGILTVGKTPTGMANTVFALPKEGPAAGRNTGAVVWGDIAKGKFTYLVGVFDNANVGSSPLFSGRLRLAFLDAEPGFWGNGSYFGDKNLLSLGVGGQFQKHGSAVLGDDKDYTEINADLLGEFKVMGDGWVTGEAAYYHYGQSDMNPGAIKDSLYVLAAFATPTVGVGHVQPMVRYQWANPESSSDKIWNIDAAVSYLIKGPALRVNATYSHIKFPGDVSSNSIQLGAQAIFF